MKSAVATLFSAALAVCSAVPSANEYDLLLFEGDAPAMTNVAPLPADSDAYPNPEAPAATPFASGASAQANSAARPARLAIGLGVAGGVVVLGTVAGFAGYKVYTSRYGHVAASSARLNDFSIAIA
eukprot:comp12192_c0_seq1/m.6958 comp12192_c0_seq1/g.6958  ORF comp12192_c0_seq1/g.6958 comp12192_c0_seq1/m.6958 type:complete len:126 (-) comp12192_c0_seq1:263-640(-)